MKRGAWMLGGVVGAVLIGVGYWQRPIEPLAPPPAPQQQVQVQAQPQPVAGGSGAARQTGAAEPARAQPFRFRSLDIDTAGEVARICFAFTRDLARDGGVRYDDYVTIEPAAKTAWTVEGDRLCATGLDFGRDYSAELKAGLPAADGSRIETAQRLDASLRNRPAMVGFGPGLILPRHGTAGVPVTTVNVERLAVRVLRIGDRMLARLGESVLDQKVIQDYSAEEMQNEDGQLVWRGTMDLRQQPNQPVTTIIPVRDTIGTRKPGAYLVLARNAAEEARTQWAEFAAQWLIDTDMGLTSFQGEDGLRVFARSLDAGRPLAGVRLVLVARGNEELGQAVTEADGGARFAPGLLRGTGGMTPVAVMAHGPDGDFTFLDLRRPAFDLTDRGVEGRPNPGPVDAFLYSDRGIYRPGETIHLGLLLRDGKADALRDVPVTVVLNKPNGREFQRLVLDPRQDGGAAGQFTLSESAGHGRWEAVASIGDGQPVGRASFLVQDFVPQKLKVTLYPPEGPVDPTLPLAIAVEARFLYGAPAAGLSGEAELEVERDPNPFPALAGYRFGVEDEPFETQTVTLEMSETDEEGRATTMGSLPAPPATSHPLRAVARISVHEPGGRATGDVVTLPLRPRPLYIGVRPLFKGGRVAEDTEAGFEIVAVDAAGKPVAHPGLALRLIEEEAEYLWYRRDERWTFQRVVRDRQAATRDLAIDPAAPARFGHVVSWGGWRLEVRDPATGAATSLRFHAGWGGGLSADSPDRVQLASDRDSYAPGDTARLRIVPPGPGQALVAIASDRIHTTRLVDLPAEGGTIDIPVDAAWGNGAYALVTHHLPLATRDKRAPARAVGVAWLGIDTAPRRLTVEMAPPEVTRPRGSLTVPLTVKGASGKAFVTLAAVDEGILQLTRFQSPAPSGHFFGKRLLGVEMRDDYGRLIDGAGTPGALRQGGDLLGGRGLEVVPTRSVALFSGVVETDAQGRAEIRLDVPDFTGQLRLMAVAWDGHRVGEGGATAIVRDPLTGEVILPRFLAPGDQGTATISLHAVEGPGGAVEARLEALDAVALAGEGTHLLTLAAGERRSITVPVRGVAPGTGTIGLALSGPDGLKLRRSWPIQVRSAQPVIHEREIVQLKPGESWTPAANLLDRFEPGTARATLEVAPWRGFDLVGLLRRLDQYPLGCVEQTTSRALPLLAVAELAPLAGLPVGPDLRDRLQRAVWRIADMQTSDGDFGMWGANDSADVWLSIYAIDFLTRAEAAGLHVPPEAMKLARGFLRRTTAKHKTLRERAYAHWVLARLNEASPGDLRYFHDVESARLDDPLSWAQLGAALERIGDRARSRQAFDQALARTGTKYQRIGFYGSTLRDAAGALHMAAEARRDDLLPAFAEKAVALDTSRPSTQEMAWMVLATQAMANGKPMTVELGGQPLGPHAPAAAPIDPAAGIALVNKGAAAVWRTVALEGVPRMPLAPAQHGLNVTREIFTLDGQPADLSSLRQNDRVVVILSGGGDGRREREISVLALLPAGLEIEGVLVPDGDGLRPWMPALSQPRATVKRDDRFAAAVTLARRPDTKEAAPAEEADPPAGEFRVGFVARAVNVGSFTLPPVLVEDMYYPGVRGNTGTGTISVAP